METRIHSELMKDTWALSSMDAVVAARVTTAWVTLVPPTRLPALLCEWSQEQLAKHPNAEATFPPGGCLVELVFLAPARHWLTFILSIMHDNPQCSIL